MPLADILLYPVFTYLQRQRLPLGISEYLAAVDAVQHGFGLEDEDQLRRLCRLLWAKSVEDLDLVDFALTHALHPQPTAQETPPAPETAAAQGAAPAAAQQQAASTRQGTTPAESITAATARPAPTPVTFQPADLPLLADLDAAPETRRVKYNLSPRLHLTRREMASALRRLRRLQRSGPADELDVEATIADYCQRGFFFGPRLVPRRRNQADLLLLVDQQGSIVPFNPLVNLLVETVLRGSRLDQVSIYYFHDCPDEVLYKRPELVEAVNLTETLASEAVGRGVLIIGDAGAARGNYETRRVADTRDFMRKLTGFTYQVAWINLLPVERWLGTTAESIAAFTPMFPLDHDGLNDAVNLLKGQPLAVHPPYYGSRD